MDATGIARVLLSAVSADEVAVKAGAVNTYKQLMGGFATTAGVTEGVIVAEVAPTDTFAGQWDEIASLDIAAEIAGGADYSIARYRHYTYPGSAFFLRHRISTALVGGTVTSYHGGLSE